MRQLILIILLLGSLGVLLGPMAALAGMVLAFCDAGAVSVELAAIPSRHVLAVRSILLSFIATLVAVALSMAPAALLSLCRGSRRSLLFGLLLAPLLLPPQVYAYAWGLMPYVGRIDPVFQAGLISAAWLWPIVTLILATGWQRDGWAAFGLASLDASPMAAFFRAVLPALRPHLLAGGLAVFVVTILDYSIPHLSLARVWATEMLLLVDVAAAPRQVMMMATGPTVAVALAVILAAFALRSFRRSQGAGISEAVDSVRPVLTRRTYLLLSMLTSLVWLLSLALPAGLMIANLHDHSAWREGFVLFAEQWRTSLLIAGLTAIVCLTISLAVVSFPQTDGQRPGFTSRLLGRTGGVIASLPALLPPAAVGIGLIVVYNGLGGWGDARPDSLAGKIARLFGNMYTDSPWVWSLGLVSRYAVVAILIVWLTTTKQSTTLIDQARVDGAGRLGVLTTVVLPTSWASMLAAGLIVLLLSLFEIVVTHLLAPPGYPSLSITLLNHMHYGRDDVVITTSLTALVVGIGVTQLCGWLLISSRSISRQPINLSAVTRRSVLTVLLLICATLPGCGKDRIAGRPPDDIFGDHGLGPGQFVYPRAMAVGPDGCVFVVDKTARIQRFSPSGEFEMSWRMPEWQAGKPTGVNTDATGRVLVSDTHYARVIMFDRDGNELARFGSDGTGPGQFRLPTAAVVDSDGNIYVSEYGGNDRISVFTPELEYLYSFGHITGPADAHLQRPQQLLIDKNDTLLVADAANHRICRFSLDGELVETFGQMGREPGQLSYPYDIVRSPDDMYLVAEYGNNRIQRFDRQGNSIETWGTPGRQPGELLAPWGVAMGKNNRLYVLDSGNNRIQMFRN